MYDIVAFFGPTFVVIGIFVIPPITLAVVFLRGFDRISNRGADKNTQMLLAALEKARN